MINSPIPAITLSSIDTVSTLEKALELENVRFVSRGRILSPAFTLQFQGVKNGDEVYVLQKNESKTHQQMENAKISSQLVDKLRARFDEKWASKFRDPDAVFKQLQDAANPTTATESARLADLLRMRIESNVSAYRKVCGRYHKVTDESQKQGKEIPTVVPEKPGAPSCTLLPELCMGSSSASPRSAGALDLKVNLWKKS